MAAPGFGLGVSEILVLGVLVAGLVALGYYLMSGRRDE